MGIKKNNSPLNQSIVSGLLGTTSAAASQPQSIAGGVVNSNTSNTPQAQNWFDPILSNPASIAAMASANTTNTAPSFGGFFGSAANAVSSAAANAAQGAMIRQQQTKQQMNNTGNVRQFTPRPQTPISPKAMSNQGNINAMFGQAIPGTFNRNVNGSPFMQMTSQGYVPPADPTNDTMGPDVNALITGNTGQPIMPPTGVQQEITPTYDLSNQ